MGELILEGGPAEEVEVPETIPDKDTDQDFYIHQALVYDSTTEQWKRHTWLKDPVEDAEAPFYHTGSYGPEIEFPNEAWLAPGVYSLLLGYYVLRQSTNPCVNALMVPSVILPGDTSGLVTFQLSGMNPADVGIVHTIGTYNPSGTGCFFLQNPGLKSSPGLTPDGAGKVQRTHPWRPNVVVWSQWHSPAGNSQTGYSAVCELRTFIG